jgi:hypothetical protein
MSAIKGATLLNNMAIKKSAGAQAISWFNELGVDLFLRKARVTIDLFFSDGTVRRIATDPITVTDGPDEISYLPELVEEPEIGWYIGMGKSEAESREIGISIRRDSIDPVSMVSSGSFLAGFGEVCIQLDGGDYTERIIVLRGQMAGGLSFGNPGEPITLSLKDPRSMLDSEFPPNVVNSTEFPDAPKESIGERAPIIYNEWPNVPCIRVNADVATVQRGTDVETNRVTMPEDEEVIATHLISSNSVFKAGWSKGNAYIKIDDEIMKYESAASFGTIKTLVNVERAQFGTTAAAHSAFGSTISNVAVYYKSEWLVCDGHGLTIDEDKGVFDGNGDMLPKLNNPVTITKETDSTGNNYTKMVFDEPSSYDDLYSDGEDEAQFTNDDEPKRVDWSSGRGAYVSVEMSEKHSVPDIIKDVMENYSPAGSSLLAASSIESLRPLLGAVFPSIIINGSGDGDQSGSLSWVESTLLPAFPMVSAYFANGQYQLCVFDARKPSKGKFETGTYPLMERVSMISESDLEDTFNEFSIRYKFDAVKGTHTLFSSIGPDEDAYCKRSETMLGTKKMPVIESPYINNESDASLMLSWYSFHKSRPYYTAEYCFAPWALVGLELGDVIELTDPEVGFSDARGVIESIVYTRGKCVVSLKIFPLIPGT